jgi:hypothetical protein
MDRDERLAKIAAIVCPVCNARPNEPCDDGVEGIEPYFHLGRGRVADALYGEDSGKVSNSEMDGMRMPISIFGPPDTEGKVVTIPVQWLIDLVNVKDLSRGTLGMVLDSESVVELMDRTPFNVGGFFRMTEDGDIERLEGSELEAPDFMMLGDAVRNGMEELQEIERKWSETEDQAFGRGE